MSSSGYTDYGYGVQLYTDDNFQTVKNFIIQNSIQNINLQDVINAEDEYELKEALDAPASEYVANIINKKEDVGYLFYGYDSCCDTDQEEMIGVSPRYPWSLTDKERVSVERVDQILEKYIKILNIKTSNGEYDTPYYFDAKYWY